MPTIAIGSSVDHGDRRGAAASGPPAGASSAAEVLDDGQRARVVEHQRGRQPQPGRGVQPVAQLDRGQRVETQLLERLRAGDRVRRAVAEHRGDVLAHQVQQQGPLLRLAQPGQPPGEPVEPPAAAGGAAGPVRGPGRAAAAARRRPTCAGRPGPAGPARRAPGRAAQAASNSARPSSVDSAPKPARDSRARSAASSWSRMPLVRCHRPQASDTAGMPGGAPVLRERVEHGVRGGVVGLPGAAEHAGGRGEQHEQRQVAGQLVQVAPRRPPWAAARCRAAPAVSESSTPSSSTPAACTTPVSGCSAGMPASSPRSASRSATSHAATVTVAPSSVSSAASSAAPSAAGAAAAGQHQVPDAVFGHEVAGQQRAEPAGAAGDQDRAVRVDRRRVAARPWRGPAAARTARRRGRRPAARRSRPRGRSSRRRSSSTSTSTNRSGYSACAARTRPHTAAAATSGTSPAGSIATAPRVTRTSRSLGGTLGGEPLLQRGERPGRGRAGGVRDRRRRPAARRPPRAAAGRRPCGGGADPVHCVQRVRCWWRRPRRAARRRPGAAAASRRRRPARRCSSNSAQRDGVLAGRSDVDAHGGGAGRGQRHVGPAERQRRLRRRRSRRARWRAARRRAAPGAGRTRRRRPRTCSGSATSANTSSPARQAARRPWNAGP